MPLGVKITASHKNTPQCKALSLKGRKSVKKERYFVGRTCDQREERRIRLSYDTGDPWCTESLGTTEWRENEEQRGKLQRIILLGEGQKCSEGGLGNRFAFLGLLFLLINTCCAY